MTTPKIKLSVEALSLKKVLKSAEDLQGVPLLLLIYNRLRNTDTKKFSTVAQGAQQTWKALLAEHVVSVTVGEADLVFFKRRVPPKAAKQPDGTYHFCVPPRLPKMKPGARREDLVRYLRDSPDFSTLCEWYNDNPFNTATSVVLLCTMCGYGAYTQKDGTILLKEPLKS